jgi:serine/threonine-protein kinase
LDRFLVPPLPVADPFELTVVQAEGGKPLAKGVVPDEAMQKALADMLAGAGGAAEVTLAQGAIAEGWGGAVMSLLDSAAGLPEWQVSVRGNEARVTGQAADRAARDAVVAAIGSEVLTVSAEIGFGPRILLPAALGEVLAKHQDCGPLALPDAPLAGWGVGAKVLVAGRMASDEGRLALYHALGTAIGDREALLDIEVLNPELCAIEAALPRAPSKGFKVIFGFGDRADPNPAGRYFVGENPVIDVVIPADVTAGNLWISIVDVTGSVFHLLPNLNRPENDVATLRAGKTGEVPVRVAYSVAEATGTPKMAFLVDDSIMGKSKIVILHAPEPVFAELRPMSESVASFAAALAGKESGEDIAPVFSIDSRILTTENP